MRSTGSWLMVVGLGLATTFQAAAKPPDLPDRPGEEWRVPLFPLGEQYREGQAPTVKKSPLEAVPPRPDLPIVEFIEGFLRGWTIPGPPPAGGSVQANLTQ
jgi:hypothetical protein